MRSRLFRAVRLAALLGVAGGIVGLRGLRHAGLRGLPLARLLYGAPSYRPYYRPYGGGGYGYGRPWGYGSRGYYGRPYW